MIFDTKLSVDLDRWLLREPVAPLGSAGHIRLAQQPGDWLRRADGPVLPRRPDLAHAPVWLTERLWLSLIIAVGFGGLVKLAGALCIGSPASRVRAGLAFALWPTFTIVIGSTSSAVLPGMLAPWAVLPLVTAVPGRGGVIGPAVRSASWWCAWAG